MKSNKQRYQEQMAKRTGGGSPGNGNNGLMWVIIFIAIFALLYSTRTAWCNAVGMCHDDLSIGTYNPLSNGIGEQR